MILVTGKTWDIRDRLKSLGGRWNADCKGWEFYTLSPEHRSEFKAHVGVMIADKPGDPGPSHQSPRYTPMTEQRRRISTTDRLLAEIFAELEKEENEPRRNHKTNMFGDDPTWFNYFADQNPTSFFGFSSLPALIKCIETVPTRIIKDDTNNRNGAWERGRFSWSASECMPDAIDIARNGWDEGVELAQEVHEQLIGRHAKQRRRKHSVAGGSVNIGRLLAGNPDHMLSRPKQSGKKVVTLFTEGGYLANIKSDHVIIRAAIIAAIIDILEMNGYSCEIVAMATNTHRNKPSWQCVTTLKAAGETLSLNDIVFALGHPSYFRRFNFGVLALDTDLREVWSSAGVSSDAFTETHTTKTNEIYVGRIQHYDRRKIDSSAPLITKAIQIWNLIVPENLPIELKEEIDA